MIELEKFNTLLDLPIRIEDNFILKGFMVPNGYQLTIQSLDDGTTKVLEPGQYSGSAHSYEEVANGQVDGWTLTKMQAPASVSVFNQNDTQVVSGDAEMQITKHLVKDGVNIAPEKLFSLLVDSKQSELKEILKPEILRELATSSSYTVIGKLDEARILSPQHLDLVEQRAKEYASKQAKENSLEPEQSTEAQPKASAPVAKYKKRPLPTELKVRANPNYQYTPKDERIMVKKSRAIFNSTVASSNAAKVLRELYESPPPMYLLESKLTPEAFKSIETYINTLDEATNHTKAIQLALADLYPDSKFIDPPGNYKDIEFSDRVVSQEEFNEQLSALPKRIQTMLNDKFSSSPQIIEGEVARFLGENFVDDFGVFAPEKEYEPYTGPGVENPIDIRAIPKYKIKGKSLLESRIQHIIDSAHINGLCLFSDEVDATLPKSATYQLSGIYATNAEAGMSATRYIHETICNYIDSQPNIEFSPRQLVYDWSSGTYGATSSTGFAIRAIEGKLIGRKLEDENGYDKYIAPNPSFQAEINDKIKKIEPTYIALKSVSQQIMASAIKKNGKPLKMYRGLGVGGDQGIIEFLADNDISLASLSCFSSSKEISDIFAESSDIVGTIEKYIYLESELSASDVSFIPALAVKDTYSYTLGSGDKFISVYQDSDEFKDYNRFSEEREAVIISQDKYPNTDILKTGEETEFNHYARLNIHIS